MNRLAAHSSITPPRRFILLPEETADLSGTGPRIRRYRLTSVGLGADRRRAGSRGQGPAAARMGREQGPLDRI